MNSLKYCVYFFIFSFMLSCNKKPDSLKVYETSASGNKLTQVAEFKTGDSIINIKLLPEEKFQTITGFGGAFTESSAYLLNQLGEENRKKIINAYFSSEGANYSLTRTHMNSCDFSLSNYSYTPVEGDKELEHFTIKEDKDDLIPFIKDAMAASTDGFKIFGSPWTAVPWMKDNNKWVGGKLLPEYYDTWALFFSKYAKNEETSKYFDGTAIHWYASTYEVFPEELQYAHEKAPNKLLIQSEACVDAQVPVWQDDEWYFKKEATDWGFTWAPEKDKHLHPKYAPVNRYARDIIGCLNNWVDGWVDWNMVLDTKGGPNWFKNWCIAPVIVDPDKDEVYFTPLYYTMAHFSKFIRPGAVRIGFTNSDDSIMVTAAKNPDNSIAVVVFNENKEAKNLTLSLEQKQVNLKINAQAIQTIMISKSQKQTIN